MERIPVLLDTDIGSDIDDAVALAYLLKQKQCDLLGITTVSGEPDKRAMLADALCQAAGRTDVPIHVGAANPLLIAPKQPHAPQAEALTADWPHRSFGLRNTAVEFLRDTIRAHPGEITLLTIGPLTNIGLLFSLDPEIPRLLNHLMIMGGMFFTRGREGYVSEWNILNDPHAAAIVFRAPVPRLTAVGLDVTLHCTMDADECRTRFQQAGGPLSLVSAMAEVWFRHSAAITFHDPLAAALLFDEALCHIRTLGVEVELVSPHAQGQTLVVSGATERPCQLAATVQVAAFFQHYFDTVGQ